MERLNRQKQIRNYRDHNQLLREHIIPPSDNCNLHFLLDFMRKCTRSLFENLSRFFKQLNPLLIFFFSYTSLFLARNNPNGSSLSISLNPCLFLGSLVLASIKVKILIPFIQLWGAFTLVYWLPVF